MTEVEKLDAEIVARAEALIDDLEGMLLPVMAEHLREAVAAKRAAMQPKQLTAGEAEHLYDTNGGANCREDMAAVLRECRKRDLALIEALPSRPVPDDEQEYVNDKLIKLSDIKSTLLDGRSA